MGSAPRGLLQFGVGVVSVAACLVLLSTLSLVSLMCGRPLSVCLRVSCVRGRVVANGVRVVAA
eukprot:12822698-Alexandrium_andersonii.AAC.1